VEALRALWESCLQFTIDRRDYKANPSSWRRAAPEEPKPINPKSITTAWTNKLFERLCKYRKDSVQLPDFPTADQLPTKFHF
jgi:hypothetical protein